MEVVLLKFRDGGGGTIKEGRTLLLLLATLIVDVLCGVIVVLGLLA